MRGEVSGLVAVGLIMAAGSAAPVQAGDGTTELVSVGRGGTRGDGASRAPAISLNGRFVAFDSFATDLVPGDTNGDWDVFVRDRHWGTTERVSLGPRGAQTDGWSSDAALSAGGRFVAFSSFASNLVPGDTNGSPDAFVRDRRKHRTELVSRARDGGPGNGLSYAGALSAHGRFVTFSSEASNLVPGDANEASDAFVRDRRRGTTVRVSVGTGGTQGNGRSSAGAISPGGRFVAFSSDASNLVPGDTNGTSDVFVRDRWRGTTERVSLRTGGAQGDDFSAFPALSAGGRSVAFQSTASNLVPGDANGTDDVFVRIRRPCRAAPGGSPEGRCPGR